MIFSELYSAYYNTVAAILTGILDGVLYENESVGGQGTAPQSGKRRFGRAR